MEIAATLIGVEDRLDDSLVGMILPQGRRGAGAARGLRVPAGAVGGAARVHREPRAHQGGRDAVGRRHARCGRAGQLAGPDARHEGRAAAARQDARRGRHRGHHHAAEARDAAGGARAAAGLHRPPGRCHRQPRVLHGDAAGRALRPLVHARQRLGLRAGARGAAAARRADGAAARAGLVRQDRADHQRADRRAARGPGQPRCRGADARRIARAAGAARSPSTPIRSW